MTSKRRSLINLLSLSYLSKLISTIFYQQACCKLFQQVFGNEVCITILLIFFKGAVSHFMHILFLYFLAILRISRRLSLIKAQKLHFFTFFCMQKTTNVRRNHCNSNGYIPPRFLHSPCFKYIVYQINSFALIVA